MGIEEPALLPLEDSRDYTAIAGLTTTIEHIMVLFNDAPPPMTDVFASGSFEELRTVPGLSHPRIFREVVG